MKQNIKQYSRGKKIVRFCLEFHPYVFFVRSNVSLFKETLTSCVPPFASAQFHYHCDAPFAFAQTHHHCVSPSAFAHAHCRCGPPLQDGEQAHRLSMSADLKHSIREKERRFQLACVITRQHGISGVLLGMLL